MNSGICFQLLAQAITKSITMTAEQVVKDDQGEEVNVFFRYSEMV